MWYTCMGFLASFRNKPETGSGGLCVHEEQVFFKDMTGEPGIFQIAWPQQFHTFVTQITPPSKNSIYPPITGHPSPAGLRKRAG